MLLGKPREVYDWLVWVMCPFCPPIIVAEDPALSLACSTPMTPCEDPSRTVIGPFGSCAHPDPHDCGLEDPALSLARLTHHLLWRSKENCDWSIWVMCPILAPPPS